MTTATTNDYMLAYEADEEDVPLTATYMAATTSDFLAHCEEHDHLEVVTTSGSGPGFCTPMSWIGFACGAFEVEGDHIET